jgi:uncharacterized protein YdeI (YjbR/CyaY-like superfamily)
MGLSFEPMGQLLYTVKSCEDNPLKPPLYFASPAEWRGWLEDHHATHDEVWVGFHKKGTGEPSLTWPESVDEALCFGWIDGVRRSVDDRRYLIRFTPRREGSNWSAVNIKRVAELKKKRFPSPASLVSANRELLGDQR